MLQGAGQGACVDAVTLCQGGHVLCRRVVRRLVELAADALVLGLQVGEAPLKGLAAGTQDGLYTSLIGEAPATAALPQPRSRDQLELDALNNYKLCGIFDALARSTHMEQGRSIVRWIEVGLEEGAKENPRP
jgi:hypothetical protein